MPTTWSTTDKDAGVTLSGGNLVASFASGNQGVRTADRVYSGKYYWEIIFTTTTNAAIGICAGFSPFATLSSGSATQQGTMLSNGGGIFNPTNTALSVGGTVTNGWIACIALDADNHLVWFRNGAAGNWNGVASHNPTTGAGGLGTAFYAAGPAFGLYCFAQGGAGSGVVTANFGATAFTGTAPSGFTSGFPSPTTKILAAVDSQIALEMWGRNATTTSRALLTQLALEQWASAGLASGGSQARALILA